MEKNNKELTAEITQLTHENVSLKMQLQNARDPLLISVKTLLIEKIIDVINDMNFYSDEKPKMNYSAYISKRLDHNYTYLADIFSAAKGFTIQQFIIISKIEKAKVLLLYGQLNLTEISYKLHYSSVAHLSGQFKKITGFSPSAYLKLKQK